MRIALPAAINPDAFFRRDPSAPVIRMTGTALGTSWSAAVVAPPSGLRDGLEATLRQIVASMSQWDSGSALSRFNRSKPGEWVQLPNDLAHVLRVALDIHGASGGAFDPACGTLADLWGFGPSGRRESIPDDQEISAALETSGARYIELEDCRARRQAPVRLDLSGIAKGHAVDRLAQTCRLAGVEDFLVEIGGEFIGSGIKPNGNPWWVDIEAPPGVSVDAIRIGMHDTAVATSGDYRRYVHTEARRLSHSIDPRTGRPTENDIVSATVLAANCMTADGWATAFTVMGRAQAIDIANQLTFALGLVLSDGSEHLSEAMFALLSE